MCLTRAAPRAYRSAVSAPTFLLGFQEATRPTPDVPAIQAITGTHTFDSREEADQDDSAHWGALVRVGTMTSTATREEKDQDYSAMAGTGTMTETREEPDQDPVLSGTETSTRTREERDQDPVRLGYFVFPR